MGAFIILALMEQTYTRGVSSGPFGLREHGCFLKKLLCSSETLHQHQEYDCNYAGLASIKITFSLPRIL
ncbi:hypothetical protein WN48_07371 [Eufriesea mexicana]|nr:hypothetical protein WN48_07371 [Eufriesea mexicana]